MNKKQKNLLIRIIIAAVFFVPLYLISEGFVEVDMPKPALIVLFLIPYLTVGYDIIRKALLGIKNGQVFDEIRCGLDLAVLFSESVEVAVGHFLQVIPGHIALAE